jgi:sulfatase modifying factor 1
VKRILSILTARGMVMSLALLAACGGDVTEATGSGGHGGQLPSAGTGGGPPAGGSGGGSPTAGSGGGSPTGGTGGGCSGCLDLEQCFGTELCVALAVTIPGGFAIDATEVTRRQYESWLATGPSTSAQPTACSWNSTFAPAAACMQSASVCQGAGCDQHPQVCVDQCDAVAYCSAVGKRLCGRIGGGPGWYDPDDAAQSQWQHACTSGGVNDFTYGTTSAAGACNDYMTLSMTTVPVGSLPGCQSPVMEYAGIFDLIGNVEEWENDSTTENAACGWRLPPWIPGAAATVTIRSRASSGTDAPSTDDLAGFQSRGGQIPVDCRPGNRRVRHLPESYTSAWCVLTVQSRGSKMSGQ